MDMRNARQAADGTPVLQQVRVDVWLDVACLFKTRSEAQKACSGGKVEVNGQATKPHRLLRVGDEVRITRGRGRRQMVVVQGLAEHHVPRAEARALYEDRTPPPTPEELEMLAIERTFRRSFGAPTPRSPDKRERRALRKLKGR
jgi:ribosome-associated heat shock protein Hsp15